MRLAITGLGLVTSVGHDLETACASIRAGIQRPHELSYYAALDLEEQESKPFVGRPVHGYTEGFSGSGLWIRLAVGAVDDMVEGGALPPPSDGAFWGMTGICAVTPAFSSRRYDEDDRLNPDEVRSSFLTPLLSALGWNMPRAHQHAISTGHTGVIDAVAVAERVIADRRLDRLVIACADSYLDLLSLEWLDAADRLKADDNPIGLIPGEAGVCILVESPDAARRRDARVLAHIDASTLAVARARPLSDDAVTGESTAEAIRQVLQMIQVASFDGMAIGDLNGESWRSQDWGSALVRLGPLLSERVRWFFPCDSLGETGAASAGVAICVGSRALARGYADSDQVLIIASGEDGAAASVVLGAADRVDTT